MVDRGMGEAKGVEGWGILVGAEEDLVEEEEEEVEMSALILWHVTGAGCMAIWPVTVLVPVHSRRHWGVPTLALPMEHSANSDKKAQEDVAEVAGCVLGALMCYMMRTGTHIPWMMQVTCTFPSTLHRMLATVRLRWKNKTQQKTEKDICQCGLCWCRM